MKFRNSITRLLIILASVGTLNGAEILETPVPWTGRITGYTVADLIARMRGWSDVGDNGSFILSTKIPEKLASEELGLIQIPEDPRPTYSELLVLALEKAGQKAEVHRGKKGIEIIYIYSRVFTISTKDRQALTHKNRWSLEGIKKELNDKGWSFSNSAKMLLLAEKSRIVILGTSDDLTRMARFFGQR